MIKIDPEVEVIDLVRRVQNKFESGLTKQDLAYKICQEFGVKIQYDCITNDSDGYYVSETNSITLNKNCTYKPRILFTLFHEIIHFLIEKEGATIIELLTDHSRGTYNYSLEKLCDLGASEFLLPQEELEGVLEEEIDIESFKKLLNDTRQISAPAIARKLAYLSHYSAVFIICGKKLLNIPIGGLLEEDEKTWENLAIEYAFSTPSFNYSLKRFHPIPETHLLQQAFNNKEGYKGEDFFPFSNPKTKWKCYIDCFLYGDRIYGILYKSRPINNENQLSLL